MRVVSLRPELTIAIGKRRIKFSRVPRADILIISTDTATELAAYFPGRQTYILDLDSRTYFVGALVKSLMSRQLNLAGYIAATVNLSRAQLAISLQDNFPPLLQIKPMLRHAKVALIQNGQRSIHHDLEGEVSKRGIANPSIDYYFAFSRSYARRLQTLLTGDVLTAGSFRSNMVIKSRGSSKEISYISTFHPNVPRSQIVSGASSHESVTYQTLLDLRLSILRAVTSFCVSNGFSFSIIGKRSNEQAIAEEQYYRLSLPETSFTYYPRKNYKSNYSLCDLSRIVISTGSTLGYESLGRGNRTAVFRPDSRLLSDESLRFGWPHMVPDEGLFWSTACSPRRIQEVLNFLTNANEIAWTQSLDALHSALPILDYTNSVLVQTLSKFGACSITHA